MNTRLVIGVIGGRTVTPELLVCATDVGREIAQQNCTLLCGGMGGVMEAACRGAKKEGGTTIGVLPGKTKLDANRFVDIPIVTAMSHARNAIIVRSADGLIAIGGSYGTLSEIALAKAIDKIVVGINTWDIEGVVRVATPQEAVRYLLDHIR